MAVKDDAEKIGVELFQDVVGAIVCQGCSPVLEHSSCSAIDGRVVGGRDSLLEQLARNLRNVERRVTFIGARDDRA